MILVCMTALAAVRAQDQVAPSIYDHVAASIEQGKHAEAEETLRSALRKNPNDVRLISLLCVVLDAEKRPEEAEQCYTHALELKPGSALLLNNLGNHYLARGYRERARRTYLRALAADPDHPNANLQLAQMSVTTKEGQKALRYLDRLPASEQSTAAVRLLRAQALFHSGRTTSAEDVLARLEKQASPDPRLAFSIGVVFVEWERFEQAEKAFTRALDADPGNFDILYNLGLAALRAGHYQRAKEIFETALRQRPEDVDCLQGLARVYADLGQEEQAVMLLVKANGLAPERPDILLLLASMTQKLGFDGDTAAAYDKYLKLRPSDDVARRERGFALARSGKIDEGLEDLRWYVQKHSQDSRGLYELGITEAVSDRDGGLHYLEQAIALDPTFSPARYARAVLDLQAGRPAAAVEDLKIVLERDPKDAHALDALGEAMSMLDQPGAAVEALARAAELLPRDPKILMHYSRSLLRAGRKEEANKVLAAFKKLGPEAGGRRPHASLVDYLNLPDAQQRLKFLANLQRWISLDPRDAVLKVRLGKYLLGDGKAHEALEIFREVHALTSDPKILADCGRTLLAYDQYEAAREFLESALAADPSATDLRLDLTVAVFHTVGPEAGLSELEAIPLDQRQGNYFLLQAQMLDAQGKPEEAIKALNRGFRVAPTRPDLYFDAAGFLIKHKRYQLAIDLLQQANHVVPETPELLLTEAIALELLERLEETEKLLRQIESRWPEWSEPYLVHGVMLENSHRSAEAKPLFETAITLGADDPIAYYYLALATTHAAPDDLESAEKAIAKAVRLSPEDPYIRWLAGKIAHARKDYGVAIDHLSAALRAWPDMVEAHWDLSKVYRDMGDTEKAAAEVKEVQRIKQATSGEEPIPPPTRLLLFAVRPPRRPFSREEGSLP